MSVINFARQLVKGKITEVIFEQMFRQQNEFTVIPVGYEHTMPELAQYHDHLQVKQVLDNIRNAPDFALISQDKSQVFLAEVKYRSELINGEILKISQNIHKKWDPCWLFVATKDLFYFESCKKIIEKNGKIDQMSYTWIPLEIQEEYLSLLNEYIR